jgi:DNA-binding NarL/FixJ family response regulator
MEVTMPSPHVVLLQKDWQVAEAMMQSFSDALGPVYNASSIAEARSSLAENDWAVLIMDLEAVALRDVRDFSQQFPGVKIICNHRLADDKMWIAALEVGAVDVCQSADTNSILRSASVNLLANARTH